MRSRIAIIGPALEGANNGNERTARRWQRFLGRRWAVGVANTWTPDAGDAPDLMIALHARRSAETIARFREVHPGRALIVVLTGTDLYRDIDVDASARKSLELATTLVVLNHEGIAALPLAVRGKAVVLLQSAPTLAPRSADRRWFDLVMVGHMRAEKDPATAWHAFERVARSDRSLRLIHVGDALDETWRIGARGLAERQPGYRWLGPLSHALTRQQIRRARLLVIPSLIEGGAHVVGEAITSGVPVLASAIPGNIGLLGRDYAGLFAAGDELALSALIERARHGPDFLALLARQCAERAPQFRPDHERAALLGLVGSLLA